MGLYFKVIEGLKETLAIQAAGEFHEEKSFNKRLGSFIDQCASFLHYLKIGNDDYG
jgi:hypothetical protein